MGRERSYKQDITYWAPIPGDDGYGGQLVAPPIYFKGHWSDEQKTYLSPTGEQVVSNATLHYPQRITVVRADGWIARGMFTDANPRTVPSATIVRLTREIPDLRNLEVVKIAML